MTTAIFNSLGSAISGATGVDLIDPAAASFTATVTATLLSVQIGVYRNPLVASAATGSLNVSLYSDIGTAPGTTIATLATITHADLPTGIDSTVDVTGFTGVTLTAGTRYWIELTDTGLGVCWTYALDQSGTGVAGEFINDSYASLSDSTAGALRMEVDIACFAAGTRIATASGETAVEHLRPGKMVRTQSGRLAPIRWIGHRRIDCRRHPKPDSVRPIAIAPGAFGPGRPARPLLLSPDHAVFVDDRLVPIRHLVNGATITPCSAARVTYYHVELDQHDIMLAAGLPVESYLDTGNRHAFANAPSVTVLHPELGAGTQSRLARAIWAARGCAPLLEEGLALTVLRRRLHTQAIELGHRLDAGAPPYLLAAGRVVAAQRLGGGVHRFTLPRGCRTITLVSTSAIPAETDPTASDRRRLGPMVAAIVLRGPSYRRDLVLSATGPGFHPIEERNGRHWRWTDGAALLDLPEDTPANAMLDLSVIACQHAWSFGGPESGMPQSGIPSDPHLF